MLSLPRTNFNRLRVRKMDDLDEQRAFNAHLCRELGELRKELTDMEEEVNKWIAAALNWEKRAREAGWHDTR